MFIPAVIYSQGGQKIVQPKLAMEYELPKNWTVKEFSGSDWELPAGNNVCPCSGTLNIFKFPNLDDYEYIHMVVYPSDKRHMNEEKRKQVWQYKFVKKEIDPDTLKTENHTFLKSVSRFDAPGDHRFKGNVVWKITTVNAGVYYTMYFWAKPALMMEYKSTIENIIAGFKAFPKI